MKTIHKSVLIWFSAQEMFDLVTDVPSYPQFLPWCDRARVVIPHEDGVTAEIGMALGGLHKSFTTRNVHTPGREVRLQCKIFGRGPRVRAQVAIAAASVFASTLRRSLRGRVSLRCMRFEPVTMPRSCATRLCSGSCT